MIQSYCEVNNFDGWFFFYVFCLGYYNFWFAFKFVYIFLISGLFCFILFFNEWMILLKIYKLLLIFYNFWTEFKVVFRKNEWKKAMIIFKLK